MGCSNSSEKDDEEQMRYRNKNNSFSSNDNISESSNEFKDFEEYNNKYIGEGIKRIKSYKCPIPYNKLNELREKFWKSKKSNKYIWKVIRECCETDNETAAILLDAAECTCKENLTRVFLINNPDKIFRVPNFCVTDPMFERDYDNIKKICAKEKEKNIKIICFYMMKNKNVKLEVSNKNKVIEVKQMFADKIGIDMNHYKIRFLFKGQELIDENLLCYNNIENESKIQVVVNSIMPTSD
jgi:hypothetical protein